MRINNRWNRLIYGLWAPVCDVVFGRLIFAPARRRTFLTLDLQPEERMLLVGIGSGADLPFLPAGISVVRVDLSLDMLARAKGKAGGLDQTIYLIQADAQRLPFCNQEFDLAALSLILSVVPDAKTCWQETVRALRPGSRVVIFDKFLPQNASLSLGRRLINQLTVLLGTDINRRLDEIIDRTQGQVVRDEPSLLRGAYRVILVRTPGGEGQAADVLLKSR
jgi:SAM-dependent methyltransferase